MSRDRIKPGGDFARWLGRWALTASAKELDGFFTNNPGYMELAARIRAESLTHKVLAEELSQKRAEVEMLANIVEGSEAPAHAFAAD